MFNYTTFSLIILAGLVTNLFWLESPWVGMIFGFGYLLFYGFKLGGLIFKESKFWKLFFGIPLLSVVIIFLSTPIYYIYQFNNFVIASVLIIIPVFLSLFKNKHENKSVKVLEPIKLSILATIFYSIFIVLESALFYILWKAQTLEAIRTPWEVIDSRFLIIYFLASLVLVILFFRKKSGAMNLILLSIHSFLTIGLGLIVYKIGYGFDPFIHRATENLIYELGQVSPKPFYYIGQYTLVVFLSKILSISVLWIDKLLLPILTTVFLPTTIYWSFKKLFGRDEALPRLYGTTIIPVLLLTVPLTAFIATTPQGLANFFILFLIFLSIGFRNYWILTLIAIATLMIHPLAGIPALIFVGFCRLTKIKNFSPKSPLLILLFFISIILIPAIFILKDLMFYDAWQGILKTVEWGSIIPSLPKFENRYGIFYDFIYFFKNNLSFIIITLAIIGAWIARKNGALPYFLSAIAVALSGALLKLFVSFPEVIAYEQADYANRLFQISGYLLLPLCLFALAFLFKKLQKSGITIKLFFILIIASLMTFSIYLTYPRVDRYDLSHNINTSISDINAVHFIEEDAGGEDYIVLANQAVSAAALKEFGFKKYFITEKSEIFYYPIPTGGILYEHYLDMVYKEPSREIMTQAMNLTGVKQGYFVLNKYWTNSERILEKAKLTADSYYSLDKEQIFVLKYTVMEE
ncbi:MAG: hypothetical protein HQ536_00020 [Parcubacteria group bacterium]|nr:hypothetical protein [Parcubacteria group bacterium]